MSRLSEVIRLARDVLRSHIPTLVTFLAGLGVAVNSDGNDLAWLAGVGGYVFEWFFEPATPGPSKPLADRYARTRGLDTSEDTLV